MIRRFIKPIITKNISDEVDGHDTAEEEPLSPVARVFQSTGLNCPIIYLLGSKTLIDVDVVKLGLVDSFVKHPRFSSLLVSDDKNGGQMSWRRTKVDIHKHVFAPDLDPNMESPDLYVEDYISNLTNTGLDLTKPLWELHVLNVKTLDANATAVLKFHHSIGDGISFISLLLASSRKAFDLESLPSLPKTRRPTSFWNNRDGFWGPIFTICTMILMAFNTLVDVMHLTATALFLKDTDTLIKGAPENVGLSRKRIVHRIVSFHDIELVKSAMNTTINDVLLGITMAALSRYLNRKYAPVSFGYEKEQDVPSKKYNNLPANIRLRSTFAFNIRPSPGILLPAAAAYRIVSNTTMTFSNIVGPQEEISFYGHHLSYIAPSAYGHPHALTVHWQSYGEKIIFVLTVDPDVIPDYNNLCADFESSLKLIKDAVLQSGAALHVQAET